MSPNPPNPDAAFLDTAPQTSLSKKILLFPLTRFVLSLLALWLGYLLHLMVSELLTLPADFRPVVLMSALLGTYIGYVRLVERRPVRELAWRPACRELSLGVAIGAALVAAIVLCIWLAGTFRVDGLNAWTTAVTPILTMAFVAFWEELVFRGIVFRMMEEGLGTWIALLASATLFGLLHLGNENATIIGGVTIVVTAGLVLAGVYILTRRLWVAIGLHFAVNAMQGPVLGLAVSGHDGASLIDSSTHGPVLLTGGEFGIEASLLMTLFGVALAGYVLKAAHRSGRFVRPLWWSTRRSLDAGGILEELL